MSEQGDRPLDAWVRAALFAEGLDGGPTDAQRSRMAGKLAAALGLSAAALLGSGGVGGGDGGGEGGGEGGGGGDGGGDGGAGAGAAGAVGTTLAGKTVALVVTAVIAGGGIGAAISELRPRARPAPQVVEASAPRDAGALDAPSVSDAALLPDAPEAPVDARAPSAPAPRDAGVTRPDAAPPMTADELARERELIDVARSALRTGDHQLAARSLIEHGMRFPRGVLVEEQRVLSIELAAAKGDLADARARANAFRLAYPRSVFRARVDAIAPP